MKFFLKCFLIIFLSGKLFSQATVGLLQQGANDYPGYVLFAPIGYTETYLIDKCGYKVHSWPSVYKPGNSVYFLPDGNLLRTGNTQNTTFSGGGKGGIIEKIDWNGNVIWSYLISDATHLQHHDIKPMANGNILVVAWEMKSVPLAIASGRDPSLLGSEFWSEKVMEIQPVGTNAANVVWEWHVWDHLVQEFDSSKLNYDTVSQHPELVHINYDNNGANNPDWLHLNSVDYNQALDQIVLSSRFSNEIWIIDHSTTTAEAATHIGGNSGKGGDLLFRRGNPPAYNRGDTTHQKFFAQHSAHWIPQGYSNGGDIMVFNNGKDRPGGNYSSVDIIRPVTDVNGNYQFSASQFFLPDTLSWTYVAPVPTDFFSMNISGAQRLSNGNTLICSGASGLFFEIDSLKNTVWQYKSPVNGTGPVSQGTTTLINNVFRAALYEANYPGFTNYTLSAGAPIETNPLPYSCNVMTAIENVEKNSLRVYPNPSNGNLVMEGLDTVGEMEMSVTDLLGKNVYSEKIKVNEEKFLVKVNLERGLYYLRVGKQIIKIVIE